MRLNRLARAVLAIEVVAGGLGISRPAVALVRPPVDLPASPQVPSLPASGSLPPVVPPAPPLGPDVAGLTAPVTSSALSQRDRIPPLRSEAQPSPPARDSELPQVAGSSHLGYTNPPDGPYSPSSTLPVGGGSRAYTAAAGPTGGSRAALDRSSATTRHAQARWRAAAERRLRETVESLSGCLSSLPSFEASVLELRAGLRNGRPLSSSQVATRLRAAPARVQGAQKRGLRGLREANTRTGCGGTTRRRAILSVRPGQPLLAGVTSRGSASVESGASEKHPTRAGSAPPGSRPMATNHSRRGSQTGAAFGDAFAPSGTHSDLSWILPLLGLTALGAVVAVARRRISAAGPSHLEHRPRQLPQRAAGTKLNRSYCQSGRMVVNPSQGVYRCVDCGFRGVLPPAFLAEVVNMQEDATSQDADEAGRGSTKR